MQPFFVLSPFPLPNDHRPRGHDDVSQSRLSHFLPKTWGLKVDMTKKSFLYDQELIGLGLPHMRKDVPQKRGRERAQ